MVKLEVGHLHRPKALKEANVFSKIGEDPQLQLSSSGDEAEKEEDISENQGEDGEENEEVSSDDQEGQGGSLQDCQDDDEDKETGCSNRKIVDPLKMYNYNFFPQSKCFAVPTMVNILCT